jgi:hypothetical protein
VSDLKRTLQNEGEAARALLAKIRSVIGDDEEAAADAVEGETNLIEAVDTALDRLAEIEAHTEALSGLVKSYKERADRLEHQSEQIRAALGLAMTTAGLRKLERPAGTLSLRAVPPKAIITSEVDLPARFYVEQNPKLDKKAVLDALKAGETVPGAELSNGSEAIQVRRT